MSSAFKFLVTGCVYNIFLTVEHRVSTGNILLLTITEKIVDRLNVKKYHAPDKQ